MEQSGEQPSQLERQEVLEAGGAQPSITTAARALALDPKGLVDQIYDSVATLCADGFDAVNRGLRDLSVCVGSEEGPQQEMPPEVLEVLWKGMEQLHATHQARIEEQLSKFEAHVMQTCLHVPAGLVATAPGAGADAGGGQGHAGAGGDAVNEGRLAALEAELAQLRGEIAATNQAARRTRREMAVYDDALQKYGDLSPLASVAGALGANKENAAEDAAAMVAKGAALQGDCQGLEQLGRQRGDRARIPPRDALAADKELLQLHPGALGVTPEDLRALQDLLARQ